MTRTELVALVAERANISVKDCDNIIRLFTDSIKERVSQGEKVTISGFGTFERRRRKATVARNPKTGERMAIAEQNVATFRAGSALKEAVKTADSSYNTANAQ
jgi:DNA-binding protein HU-beta